MLSLFAFFALLSKLVCGTLSCPEGSYITSDKEVPCKACAAARYSVDPILGWSKYYEKTGSNAYLGLAEARGAARIVTSGAGLGEFQACTALSTWLNSQFLASGTRFACGSHTDISGKNKGYLRSADDCAADVLVLNSALVGMDGIVLEILIFGSPFVS